LVDNGCVQILNGRGDWQSA